MELSAILGQYYPQPSNTEQALAPNLNPDLTPTEQERYEQQLKRLEDARNLLKQLPDSKSSKRQNKSEKAKILKERLKMLKQMIPFMSASAVKSLKAELRQIASQIASLSEDGVTAGGISVADTATAATANPTATTAATAAESTETAAPQTTAAAEAAADEASAAALAEGEADPAQQEQSSTDAPATATSSDQKQEETAKTRTEREQERALKESLEELKLLFHAVRAMVQRKLQQDGHTDSATAALPAQMQAYLPLPDRSTGLGLTA